MSGPAVARTADVWHTGSIGTDAAARWRTWQIRALAADRQRSRRFTAGGAIVALVLLTWAARVL
ncbi:MAG: hypothetical protein AB7K63_20805 [Vicinamibacterales bacterium]